MKWRSRQFFLLSLVFMLMVGLLMRLFLEHHQEKVFSEGIVFEDPLFEFFPRGDVSIALFSTTYGALILFTIIYFKNIEVLTSMVLVFALHQLLRMVTMTLLPLKPPVELVHLQDPFLSNLIYPGNITTDLFYSGHTAFVFSMYFLTKRIHFLILGIVVVVLLMVQRTHFSIDIFAAILASWFLVIWVKRIRRKFSRKVGEG